MEGILIPGIIIEISKHLTVANAYMFKMVNKICAKTINISTMLIQTINMRLSDIVGQNTLPLFKRLLQDHEAVISGSFIIQCILGEDWKTDVDIMTLSKNVKDVKTQCIDISDIDDKLYKMLDHEDVRYDPVQIYADGFKDIKTLRTYILKNTETAIQCVIFKDSENLVTSAFVFQHADFDICRNVYGIDKTDKTDKDGSEYIKIYKMHQICTKRAEFKLGKVVANSIRRHENYVRCGFEFTNDLKPFFDTMCSTANVYSVFYVKRIIGKGQRFRLVEGSMKALLKYSVYGEQGYPKALFRQINEEEFEIKSRAEHVNCDQNLRCPVKFCFGGSGGSGGNSLEQPEHFHINGGYSDPIKYIEVIFILV